MDDVLSKIEGGDKELLAVVPNLLATTTYNKVPESRIQPPDHRVITAVLRVASDDEKPALLELLEKSMPGASSQEEVRTYYYYYYNIVVHYHQCYYYYPHERCYR